MKHSITGLLCLLPVLFGWQAVHADDFNPSLPPEPMTKYVVTVSADPAAGAASLSGAGKYSQGAAVTVNQTVATDYRFDYWTLNGIEYATTTSVNYTIGDSAVHFVAHYTYIQPEVPEIKQVNISVNADPATGGTVSGAGLYTTGQYATLAATANTNYGWSFDYWNKDGVFYSSQAVCTYLVGTEPAEFVAHFTYSEFDPATPSEPTAKYRVYTSSNPANTATLTGEGVYSRGEQITVKAVALSGWQFNRWTLNGHDFSNNTSFSYTVGDSVAYFVAVMDKLWSVNVAANPSGAGTVTGSGTYLPSTTVTLKATAKAPYQFDYWTLNGVRNDAAASFAYTVGDSAALWVANFKDTSIVKPFDPTTPPEPLVYTRITATAPENYYFVSWNDGNTDNPRMVLASEAENYTPVFAPVDFEINTTATICSNEYYMLGDQRVTLDGVYKATLRSSLGSDSIVTLTLKVLPAYFYATTDTIYNDGSVQFIDTLLTTPGLYQRRYKTVLGCDSIWQRQIVLITDSVTVTALVNHGGWGTVSGGGKYLKGGTATLKAEPAWGYHFTHWNDGLADPERQFVAMEDIAFTANFAVTTYEIKFVDWDGAELKKDSLPYGTAITAPIQPLREGYTFTGWDKTFSMVDGDILITAQYRINYYEIKFVDWDGAELQKDSLSYGTAITAPADPSRKGYTFTGWNRTFSTAAADLTITAQYSINRYEVKFVDWNGKELKKQTVTYGGSATAPSNPTRQGYIFTGWDKAFGVISEDIIITAQYRIILYEIKFVDWDGAELQKDSLSYGTAITAPADPSRKGYTFTGWNKTFSTATANMTITAQYSINSYEVRFVDWDGKVLKKETVIYGGSATAPSDPTRDDYIFAGWDKAFSVVEGDLIVTAVYRSTTLSSVSVDVLVPTDCDMDISNGLWLCWWAAGSDDRHYEAMAALPGRHFTATFNPNAASYSYYVLNAENPNLINIQKTSSINNIEADRHCSEVYHPLYEEQYGLSDVGGCGMADHDYRPQNTSAVIGDGSVTLYWQQPGSVTPNAVVLYIDYGSYTTTWTFLGASFDGTTYSQKCVLSNADDMKVLYWAVRYNINGTSRVYGHEDGFTVPASTKLPTNLLATDNGDNTYTLSWQKNCEYTQKISIYGIVHTGTYREDVLVSNVIVTGNSYVTPAITDYEAVFWKIQLYDENQTYAGQASSDFYISSQEPRTVSLHVYIPVNADFASTGEGYALQWNYVGFAKNTVPLVSEGNNWYKAELANITQSYIYVSVLNALNPETATICLDYGNAIYDSKYLIINRNENGERFVDIVSANYYPNDYLPYNLQAVPGAGNVSLSFKTNESSNYGIFILDEEGKEVYTHWSSWDSNWNNQIDAVLSNETEQTYTWYIRTYDNQSSSYWNEAYVYGASFTVAPSPYIPQNLQAVYNGDGTCTVSWKPMESDEVNRYTIRIDGPRGTTGWAYPAKTDSTAIVRFTADACGKYTATLWPIGKDGRDLAHASATFNISPVPERDIAVRILVQPGSNYDTSDGVKLLIIEDKWTTVTMTPEGEGWYNYTLKSSSPGVRISIDNYSTYFVVTQDTCLEYIDNLHRVSCDAHIVDYAPYNLQASPVAGQVTLSWSTNNQAQRYYVVVYSDGKLLNSEWYYDKENKVSFRFSNTEAMNLTWSVRPYQNGWAGPAVYGEEFTVPASPYVPQNLAATDNGDGSFTLSWSAVTAEDVKSYSVSLKNPNGDYVFGGNVTTGTSYNTGELVMTGVYTYYVYTLDENWMQLGSASATFELAPLPEHEITIRMLVHPDCGQDISNGVGIYVYNLVTQNWDVSNMVSQGGNWYIHSLTTTDRAVYVAFSLDEYNYYTVTRDTCFQYDLYGLQSTTCDAVAHDYRVIPESMKAVSLPGRVTFTWSALDKSENYRLRMVNAETGSTIRTFYINDTCYSYMVQDKYDSITAVWRVSPYGPYTMAYVEAPDTIMLLKSNLVLDNLTTETTDTVTFDLGWRCNVDTVLYEINIHCQEILVKHDIVNVTNYRFTVPCTGEFYWQVRLIDRNDHTPLSGWKNSKSYYPTSAPDLITNLKGTADGHMLSFTWEMTVPQVRAEIYKQDESGSYEQVADSIMQVTGLSYEVDEDGLYIFQLRPYIEYEAGQYTILPVYVYTTVLAFKNASFTLQVDATEGGYIWPEDMSGTYSAGFSIVAQAYSYEHYRFVKWSDGVTDATRTITMNSNLVLTAQFERIPQYHLSVTAGEGGLICVSGMLDYDASYDGYLDEQSNLLVTASASEGYSFYQWSDGVTYTRRTLNLSSDTMITAIFKPLCYLAIGAAEGGTVDFAGNYMHYDSQTNTYAVSYGTQATLQAIPNDGYRFVRWSDGEEALLRAFTITGDTAVSAVFETTTATASYYVYVYSESGGSATYIDGYYYEGDQLVLTATPWAGYRFTGWSDGVTDNPRTLVVTQDTSLAALFEPITVQVTVLAGENGKIVVGDNEPADYYRQSHSYLEGISIQAIPDEHCHFVRWSDGYTDANRTMSPLKDTTITAVFALDMYAVTFINDDGSFIETKQWAYGTTPSCSITPQKQDAEFTGWTPEIVPVTGDAVYMATYSSGQFVCDITFALKDDPSKSYTVSDVPYGTPIGTLVAQVLALLGGDRFEDDTYIYTYIGLENTAATDVVTESKTYYVLYSKVEKTPTALENAKEETHVTKFLHDGQIFILRGEKIYTVTGQEVK